MQVSKERELLRKISRKTHLLDYDEIEELLAQPEQEPFRGLRLNGDSYPQEPVVWQYRYQMDFEEGWLAWCSCSEDDYLAYQTPGMFENVTYETRKLYTSPPKREPLSEGIICPLYDTTEHSVAFARAIEKAHGIGVDDV
jgi:hypothetical protein